jgi:hypothetical protein
MPARTSLAAALLVTLAFIAAACSSGDAELGEARPTAVPRPSAPSPTGSGDPEPAEPPGEIPAVLGFEGPLLDGGTLDGATLADKDVAFWFWAPW